MYEKPPCTWDNLQMENKKWRCVFNLVQLQLPESPLTDHISCKRSTACGRPATIIQSLLSSNSGLVQTENDCNKVEREDPNSLTSSLISLFSASYTAPPQRTQPWNLTWKIVEAELNFSYPYKIFHWRGRLKRPLCVSALMSFLLIVIFPATRL